MGPGGRLAVHEPFGAPDAGVSAVELQRGTGLRPAALLATMARVERQGIIRPTALGPDGLPRYLVVLGPEYRLWAPLRRPRWRVSPRHTIRVVGSLPIAVLAVLVATAVSLYLSRGDMPVDLEVYRRGGQAVLNGTSIYDQPTGWLPFTYPPLAAIVFSGLALLTPAAAAVAAALGSFVALTLLARVTLTHLGLDLAWAPAVVLAAGALEPVTATVDYGQINLVLAAMVLTDLLRPSKRWSGVLLGLAICIKVTPAIFLLLPLLHRDVAMLRRALLTAATGTLLPAVLLPTSWLAFWFHALWDPQRVGGLPYAGNQSVTGAVWRATGPGGAPALTYLISAAVLAFLVRGIWLRPHIDRLAAVLACAFAGLLISPVSWSHHWVWVVPLILWAIHQTVNQQGSVRSWVLLISAWSAATLTRVIWIAPYGTDREYGAPLALKLATDTYTLLGILTLTRLLHQQRKPSWRGRRPRGRGEGRIPFQWPDGDAAGPRAQRQARAAQPASSNTAAIGADRSRGCSDQAQGAGSPNPVAPKTDSSIT